MRLCESCGDEVSGRRKKCSECKRAEHAQAEKARRDAARERMAGVERPEPAVVAEVVQSGNSIGGARYQFATAYRPRPAAPEPEEVDYTKGGHSAPATSRLDLAGIPNAIRQDRAKLEATLRSRELGSDEDASDMMTWGELQERNSRPDDGRKVTFDKPALGSPHRQARPDEGRTLSSMLSTGREPNVDALGRSTRRPRSWR